MPALIDYDLPFAGGGGIFDWETDAMVTRDPAGFDTARATICFKGRVLRAQTIQRVPNKFSFAVRGPCFLLGWL